MAFLFIRRAKTHTCWVNYLAPKKHKKKSKKEAEPEPVEEEVEAEEEGLSLLLQ